MDITHVFDFFSYLIPAIITGLIAYYFFNLHTKNEEGRRRYLLHKEIAKDVIPYKLQAYERMTLFLERINPTKLLIRVAPADNDKTLYEGKIIAHIESEFEHNLAQQIYISDETWNVIKTSKNTTIQMIRNTAVKAEDAYKLRDTILNSMLEKQPPSNTALQFLKKEVNELLR